MSKSARREALRRTLRRSLDVILPSDTETSLLRCHVLTPIEIGDGSCMS